MFKSIGDMLIKALGWGVLSVSVVVFCGIIWWAGWSFWLAVSR